MTTFTPEQRTQLRAELLDRARGDNRIAAGAITGSGAMGREDRWSDIDLAFALKDSAETGKILSEWTQWMYDAHQAVHHLDIQAGAWLYRVFLLTNTLQVDLAFVPAEHFRPLAPTFRLIFGEAKEAAQFPAAGVSDTIGLAWLYALHARSCIARKQFWQAEYMISALRDQALTLACIRHGLPSAHGKGLDLLPTEVISPFTDSLVRYLDEVELARCFRTATEGLLAEILRADRELHDRLAGPLHELLS